ncbi:hypothetical protein MVEN_00324200 [Mycena venus]|uniref:Extracellular serine-rich protein n=1 Tax=Mycena venus TaxID=2733690 RepID=A0A8H6YTF3_9AGAR|nr:hypothetical protein MVEN_00324200 [Mycena venus]
MRTSVFAVFVTFALAYGQQVIQVAVGGGGGAPQFNPNKFNAANGTIIRFQFTGNPGNHTVTQSSFAKPCEPMAGGFDSGWISVPTQLNPPPEWNITVTNDQVPIWFYCKQLTDIQVVEGPKPHCNQGMLGAVNIGGKSFDIWTAAAAAATTVGQAQGGLGGIAATATAPPFIPFGAVLITGDSDTTTVTPPPRQSEPMSLPGTSNKGTSSIPSTLLFAASNNVTSSTSSTSLSAVSNNVPSPTPGEVLPAPGSSETSQLGRTAKKPTVGAIVGGIVGAFLLVTGILVAFWCHRRRRLNCLAEDLTPQPYSTQMAASNSVPVQNSQHSKRTPRGVTSTSAMASRVSPDIPTSELAWALYHRMQNQDFAGSPPPPGYV